MLDYHRPLHQNATRMEFALRNAIDAPHSREAYQLTKMMKDYRAGVERGEHARTLEARVHGMEMYVQQNQSRNTGLMSTQDANRFRQTFRDTINKDIRRLPHY